MKSIHFAVVAVALAAAPAVSAQTATYTAAGPFMAAVAPGSYTELFSDDSFINGFDFAGFSSSGFSYTVSAPNALYGNGSIIGTNVSNEALTIAFTGAPVTAVGGNFFVSNIDNSFQLVPVTVTLSDGTTTTFTPTNASADSFRGFTSTVAITSLTIGAPGALLYANMDNFTVGSAVAVPEPTSYMLFALGLGGLLLASRRQASD